MVLQLKATLKDAFREGVREAAEKVRREIGFQHFFAEFRFGHCTGAEPLSMCLLQITERFWHPQPSKVEMKIGVRMRS